MFAANDPYTPPEASPKLVEYPPRHPALAAINNQILPEPETHSIWDRIRAGFRIPDVEHKRIDQGIAWYARHPDYLNRVAQRAEPFLHLIVEEIEAKGLPTELALLPVVESAFQVFAYSHGRAAGIWQFIPSTGRLFKLKQNWWYDGRRDVYASTRAAMQFFGRLDQRFKGDWLHSLAAYNSGDGTVLRAIRRNHKRGRATDYWSLDLPTETEGYVPKLLALKAIIANPAAYGIDLLEISDRAKVTPVDVGGQIDLALAAELAELPIADLYQLNPGFNRWATDPNGPHRLLLPLENAELFTQALAEVPPEARVTWDRYQIKAGETLSQIAEKTGTTIKHLKNINNIRGTTIRAGKHLIVPKAAKNPAAYRYSQKQRQQRHLSTKRAGTKHVHTVQAGDTLWDLSRRYAVSPRHLASWNGLAVRDPIRPGQKLTLWLDAAKVQKASLQAPGSHGVPIDQAVRAVQYRVRKGDSLSRIASKFSVTVNDLLRWNPTLKKVKYLQPKQRVKVYVDVRKQAG